MPGRSGSSEHQGVNGADSGREVLAVSSFLPIEDVFLDGHEMFLSGEAELSFSHPASTQNSSRGTGEGVGWGRCSGCELGFHTSLHAASLGVQLSHCSAGPARGPYLLLCFLHPDPSDHPAPTSWGPTLCPANLLSSPIGRRQASFLSSILQMRNQKLREISRSAHGPKARTPQS